MQPPSVPATNWNLLFILFCCLLFSTPAAAKDEPEMEEITLSFNITGFGSTELDAVIRDKDAYLSVTELFDYLKIKNQASAGLDSVSGFFLLQKDTYVIDKTKNQISLRDKVYTLKADDLIRTPSGLYLRSAVFALFGLDCAFNFRALSVNLTTKLDFPALHEKRQELMRQNISSLNSNAVADTTISRKFSVFNFGSADWSATSTQQEGNTASTFLRLKMGAVVLGGETNVSLNYNTQGDFDLRQQNYLWRYVNNDNSAIRQISAGKIAVQSTASILSPVIGVQITNAPTTYRRSFGTYTLSDFTKPEWTVELYINNVLVDYKKADASGFYSFQVPMVYGSSMLRLRFFGPWGEEITKEQSISVPYNFLPEKEMEYTASSGIVEDGSGTAYSRLEVKYGLSHHVTVGSGAEYLSSVTSDPFMPFINTSVMLTSNLLLSGDYTYGVRARAIASYRTLSDLLFELNYTHYKNGQQAILNGFTEEKKLMISKSFRGHGFTGLTRLSIDRIQNPQAAQTITDLLLSCSWQRISSNLTTYATYINKDEFNVYSNLSLAFSLPFRYALRPQIQYTYREKRINSTRLELEKQVFGNGYLNIAFDNNFSYHTQNLSLGLRLDLSFMRTSLSANQANRRTTLTQSLSGGLTYDAATRSVQLNNRTNVGRAGLVIYPYLDLNGNNKREATEPKVAGLQLKINGGRVQYNSRDTTIRVIDMEPYNSYLLEFNRNSFDNIAWQLKNATYKITPNPNQTTVIEIPVQVCGEVSGSVLKPDGTGKSRLTVSFYRNGTVLAGHTVTESDGYFNFLGLPPGSYTARLDTAQLEKLHLSAPVFSKAFKIKPTIDGDVVSNIDFLMKPS